MRKHLLSGFIKKTVLVALAIFSVVGGSLFAQTIEGGAGIIHVNGDPNGIVALQDVSINEAHIAYDTSAQVVYFFDQNGTAGVDQWIAIDINSVVSDVQGAGDINVTNVGSVYTVSFTEALTTLAWNAGTNSLTYVDEDGASTVIDLSGAVDFANSANINVSGSGTSASPYTFILDGSDTPGNNGFVPVTDGAGNLTWEKVVKSATFTATGELQLTFTDNTTALVNMESIPTVANVTELTNAANAVNATSGGIARAAASNTFGLPANSNVGVLFFISR
jgi:hypothetical protein